MGALPHSGNVFPGDHPSGDGVDELEGLLGVGGQGLKAKPNVTVLTLPPGLADEFTLNLNGLSDGLAVGHLRLTDLGFNLKFPAQAVNDDIEMELAHA